MLTRRTLEIRNTAFSLLALWIGFALVSPCFAADPCVRNYAFSQPDHACSDPRNSGAFKAVCEVTPNPAARPNGTCVRIFPGLCNNPLLPYYREIIAKDGSTICIMDHDLINAGLCANSSVASDFATAKAGGSCP